MTASSKMKTYGPTVGLIICLTGLPQLSETIYTPALVDIANSLVTTQGKVQWTLSIYFLGFALGVLFWGWYSDRTGRRFAMHSGYLTYIIASLLCAFSVNITMLMGARLLQAFGASVGSVITQAVLRDRFTGKERHKLFSVVGYALGLAPVLGPMIGGFMVHWFEWSANLLLLAVLGIGVISYSWLSLPETLPAENRYQRPHRITTVLSWLLNDHYVMASAYLVGAFNGLLFSYYSEAPFIFINVLHLSSAQYGMLGFVIALGYMVGTTLSHRLNDYYSPHSLIGVGCLLSVIGSSLLVIISTSGLITASHVIMSTTLILSAMFFIFVAFSLSIPNILSTALTDYAHVTGTASSVFGLMYYMFIGLWTFLMGSFQASSVLAMPLYFLAISLSMGAVYLLRQSSWPVKVRS